MTEKHSLASEITDDGRLTEVVHIGYHDPSGAHLFLALKEDVSAFARAYGGTVAFTRLAVTPDDRAQLIEGHLHRARFPNAAMALGVGTSI